LIQRFIETLWHLAVDLKVLKSRHLEWL
jgi:hypothetical protein